jgi:transposase
LFAEFAESEGMRLDDAPLERKLFVPAGYNPPRSKPLPEWEHIHTELCRRGVTLGLLWEECRVHHPDGHGYSRFCDLYVNGATGSRRPCGKPMRRARSVDFAGDTVPVFDGLAGEVRAAKILGIELHLGGEPLRAGRQPDLPGSRRPLRHHPDADAARTLICWVLVMR